jgi:competence protein ComEC
MTSLPAAALSIAAGAWWRAALVLAWVGGSALQLQQPALWADAAYPLMLAASLAAVLVARRLRTRRQAAAALALAAAAAAGFALAGWRAQVRLADALAPECEGRDVELVGVVDGMPQVAEDGQHFAFVVESARALAMSAQQKKRLAGFAAADGHPMAPEALAAIATRPRGDAGEADEPAAPAPAGGAPGVPSRVWLSWDANPRDDRAVAAAPAPLAAAQRWRLPVRLRQPHGALNPDGFDAELWLFDQGLRATGTVRGGGELLATGWAPIEHARQWVRDRLLLRGGEAGVGPQAAGALAALAVGDQAAVDGAGWEVFRNTGVAHLMSISGLHITMLAWLGGRAIGVLWRRSERLALLLATPVAARWGGVGVAWLYALLAGWGVPAQRTVVMLAATALLRGLALDWPAPLVALAAMVPVSLLDPWAILQPGFWLSFAAVGLLMVSEPVRRVEDDPDARLRAPRRLEAEPETQARAASDPRDGGPRPVAVGGAAAGEGAAAPATARTGALVREAAGRAAAAARGAGHAVAGGLRAGARAQVVASVGLAPLTLVAFQQVSLVGLLANLVAEPWVTLVVTPLALGGVFVPALWTLAALALRPLLWLLAVLARWPLASVHVATPPAWGLVAGLAGGALMMLPLPWRLRLAGLPLLLPLVAPFVARPPVGRFELVAADVGQGSAVLVRTHAHLLLFDTGPRFGADSDAGRRMLLPLLQARGEARVDALVLSHADADHVGGAQSIIDRMPVAMLRSSLDPANPLRANALPHVACVAGQQWTWDGVGFRMLHPFPDAPAPGKTNAASCVLRVVDADRHSALLTGDIEAPQEAALVARDSAALASDVLLVPHHGSRTSSTTAFIAAVHPRRAVIQVGYRSRYGHPAPDVVARYRAAGIALVRTDQCGAWTWRGGEGVCTRAVRRRYWSWKARAPPPGSAAIVNPTTAVAAGAVVAIDSPGTSRGATSMPDAGGSPSSP